MLVWTASKGTEERLQTYKDMVRSVRQYYPDAIFILSASYDHGLDDLRDDHIQVMVTNKHTVQFDHLAMINIHAKDMDPSTQVLFMDDDDLMLGKPSIDTGVVLGHGYVPTFDDGCMIQDEKSMRECLHRCITDVDFCGSMAPLSMVRLYFDNREPMRMFPFMEDCTFVKHLEGHGGVVPSKPYIFYRQWPNGNDWMSSIIDELRTLVASKSISNARLKTIISLAKQHL